MKFITQLVNSHLLKFNSTFKKKEPVIVLKEENTKKKELLNGVTDSIKSM